MRFSHCGGLLIVLAFLYSPSPEIGPQHVSAQQRRLNSLHSKHFDRRESGIYSGTRDNGYGSFRRGNYGHSGYGYRRYGGGLPFAYTPYLASPYLYDPTFVSPGFTGGFVDPYSPYGFPTVGYGNRFFGVEFYGPQPLLTAPPIAAPLPLNAPATPVDHQIANSKEEARRLRAMMRNSDPERLPLPPTPMVFKPSTPEQKLASLRQEQSGDRDFQAGRYLLAYTHYKDAIDQAEDRTEPRAKLVVTLATVGQYSKATNALRSLLELDPIYPQHFLSLDSIFGDRQLTKESMKTRVAQWTAQHVANPERLLLLGAIMYFDGEIGRSRQLFEKVMLYEDLAPLAQSFMMDGGPVGDTAPPLDVGPLDIPFADIPSDVIPYESPEPEIESPIAPPLPGP